MPFAIEFFGGKFGAKPGQGGSVSVQFCGRKIQTKCFALFRCRTVKLHGFAGVVLL